MAVNSFLFLLHWLRTGSSIEQIVCGFDIHKQTLHKGILEVIDLTHDDLVNRSIASREHAVLELRSRHWLQADRGHHRGRSRQT
jgi:hypothetical protein